MTSNFGKCFRSALALAAGAAACLGAPNNASAAAHDTVYVDANSEQVNIADLDLRAAAGQRQLKDRIRSAALRVCKFDGFLDTACVDMSTVDGLNQAYRSRHVNSGAVNTAAVVIISAQRN